MSYCQTVVPYPNQAGEGKSFDWNSYLESALERNNYRVLFSSELTSQVEKKLDNLLVVQEDTLFEQIDNAESNLYRAVQELDAAVQTIRGIVSISMPGPLVYDGELRSELYDKQVRSCFFRINSRVVDSAGPDVPMPELPNALKSLAAIDGAEKKVQLAGVPQGYENCSKTAVPIQVNHLIDGKAIRNFIGWAMGKDGSYVPEMVSDTTLVQNLAKLGEETSIASITRISLDLQLARARGNEHPFLKHHLSRLKALQITRQLAAQ